MPPTTRRTHNRFSVLEKILESQRSELRSRIQRHRMDVVVAREPDDEAAEAYENISKDMLAVTLERERRTLQEIESALNRMKKGEYGTCDGCNTAIPQARLDAVPWTRLCVHCADRCLNSTGFRVSL